MKKLCLIVVTLTMTLGPLSLVQAKKTPECFGRRATIVGTAGRDDLNGTPKTDVIVGLGGGDRVRSGAGADLICLGSGRTDQDGPTSGYERAEGGDGNDHIAGGPGPDCILGGRGNDVLTLGPTAASTVEGVDDCAAGGPGADRVVGSEGGDLLGGGPGKDRLIGGGARDGLDGGPGSDYISGGSDDGIGDFLDFSLSPGAVTVDLNNQSARGYGQDTLEGVENVHGSINGDHLIGSAGPNLIFAGSGDDVIEGGAGDDCIFPFLGTNTVDGGDGFDFYSGGGPCTEGSYPGGALTIGRGEVTVDLAAGTATSSSGESTTLSNIEGAYGTPRGDSLSGDEGPNTFFGGNGRDRIQGFGGDDAIDGGNQEDTGDGGEGSDTCVNVEVVVACESGDPFQTTYRYVPRSGPLSGLPRHAP